MKKLLLSLVAIAMSTVTFAQDWLGTQFEIAAGGNCTMEAPVEAERFCQFQGKWGSITPSITSFSEEVYKKVVINFAEPIDTYYNVPYKNAEGTQIWNASTTNGAGAEGFLIDIENLHSISELFIQNVDDQKAHSFTITEAYAEKQNGEKEFLSFTAGWNASVMVKGIKSGKPTFNGQWANMSISNDIIGVPGKKLLRIYTNSNLYDASVQWCIKTAAGNDGWPQINKISENYGECLIEDELASIVLQWTSKEAGTMDIAAITWEVIPEKVTLNAKGLATFSAATDVTIATDGVKAYKAIVDVENMLITLEELDGDIPAGTGVILYGAANANVELAASEGIVASNLEDNALQATTNAQEEVVARPAGNVYALKGNEFLAYTGNALVANKAFIEIHENAASLRILLPGETTAINSINSVSKKANGKFIENYSIVIVKNGKKYNLAGQIVK